MTRLISLVLTGCVAFLVSCSTVPVAPEKISELRNVGVVSLLGTTFNGFTHGLTVFGNARYTGEVPEWQVDAFATAQMIELLKGSKASTVRRVDISSVPLPKFYPKDPGTLDPKIVLELARSQGFDTLVVLVRTYDSDYQLVGTGYGWYDIGFGALNKRHIFATVHVLVYDVATGKVIGSASAIPKTTSSQVDVKWQPSFKEIPPGDLATLRAALEKRLSVGLVQAFERLGLIPSRPKS